MTSDNKPDYLLTPEEHHKAHVEGRIDAKPQRMEATQGDPAAFRSPLRALAERAAREILPSSCWHSELANERRKRMIDAIERVARQAVEAEREACAKIAEDTQGFPDGSHETAALIRAREGKT